MSGGNVYKKSNPNEKKKIISREMHKPAGRLVNNTRNNQYPINKKPFVVIKA